MANFKNMSMTTKGKILYAKAQAGTELHFTKMMVGSGLIGTQNPETLLALIDPKYDVGIQSITPNTEAKTATISGMMNNSNITDPTYICEIGLCAQDPDDGEILYAYGSAGNYGDYMAPATSGAYSWNYQIIAAVGNAANVTVELSNLVYDYGVVNTNTTFEIISGGNQKEINKSIDGAFKNKVNKTDYARAPGYAVTSGTSTAYAITLNPAPTAYVDGMQVTILPHTDCGANPTLNINGLGALPILNNDGTAINAGDINANKPLSLVRVGSSFFIRSAKKTSIFDRIYSKNPWAYMGIPMPTARYASVSEIYNGKIYVIGGLIGNATNKVEIYDIKTNSWSIGSNMPTARWYSSSVLYNGKIYVMGGYVSSSTSTNIVEIYDIETNTWSPSTNMPVAKDSFVAEVYNGKIYCIGGSTNCSWLARVDIFNIIANTWATGTAAPVAKCNHTSILCNGKIYVMGGNSSSRLDIYNIAANTWSVGANLLSDNLAMVSELYNNKIYCIGGNTSGNATNRVEIYDIVYNTWSIGMGMPTPRYGLNSILYKGKIFAIGGLNTDVRTAIMEIYVIDWNLN